MNKLETNVTSFKMSTIPSFASMSWEKPQKYFLIAANEKNEMPKNFLSVLNIKQQTVRKMFKVCELKEML
jgi:hypothetical protein